MAELNGRFLLVVSTVATKFTCARYFRNKLNFIFIFINNDGRLSQRWSIQKPQRRGVFHKCFSAFHMCDVAVYVYRIRLFNGTNIVKMCFRKSESRCSGSNRLRIINDFIISTTTALTTVSQRRFFCYLFHRQSPRYKNRSGDTAYDVVTVETPHASVGNRCGRTDGAVETFFVSFTLTRFAGSYCTGSQ